MNRTRLHILCDNHALDDFGSEHGLSLAIELPSGALWLWDTGQSGLFLDNAAKMGIDPASARGVALSHGHYDHTGGLDVLFGAAGYAGPVHAHPSFTARRYATDEKGTRQVGLGARRAVPEMADVRCVEGMADLDERLTMFTPIERREGAFEAVAAFHFDIEGMHADRVEDDACLLLHTASGPVLVLGCCHSGLANTLHHVAQITGLDRFHAVVGGMHLMSGPDWAVDESIAAMEAYGINACVPGHCTGDEAAAAIAERFSGEVRQMAAGMVLEF